MDDNGAKSSNGETPEISYNFYFEMKPLSKLRSALKALADGEFCESGIGRIRVESDGFKLSVVNPRNNVAQLWLHPEDLIVFQYFKPLTEKYVALRQICRGFLADLNDDEDIVRVFHIVGSNQIRFQLGRGSSRMVSALLFEHDAQIEDGPALETTFYTISLPTSIVTEMIEVSLPDFPAEDPSTREFLVSTYPKKGAANIRLRDRMWKTCESTAKEEFQSWFNWNYIAFLKKAASVTERFEVDFYLPPASQIIFRFTMGEFSCLTLTKELLSSENPTTNYSFYFEMKPLQKLRHAIGTMADPWFNAGNSETTFYVNKGSFTFMVQNTSNAFANLWLQGSKLVSFRCYTPLVARLGPLKSIYDGLPTTLCDFQDTICIFHVRGTTKLWFKFGTTHPSKFSVDFSIINPGHRLFPEINVNFSATMEADDTREMIDSTLEMKDPRTVLVTQKANTATFLFGNKKIRKYDSQNEGGTIMVQQAEFNWSYTAMLRRASRLDSYVSWYLLSVPKDSVMFQFSIGGVGCLSIVKRAL